MKKKIVKKVVKKVAVKRVPVEKVTDFKKERVSLTPELMTAYGCTDKKEFVGKIMQLASLVAYCSSNSIVKIVNLKDERVIKVDIGKDL